MRSCWAAVEGEAQTQRGRILRNFPDRYSSAFAMEYWLQIVFYAMMALAVASIFAGTWVLLRR